MILSRKFSLFLFALVLTICATHGAFAQVSTFSGAQGQIAKEISIIPKLTAVFAYVIGTFFAATGLVKLKDWMHEPDKNPINAVIIRMIVAVLLISLPHVLILANNSIFASEKTTVNVPMQSLSTFQKAQ